MKPKSQFLCDSHSCFAIPKRPRRGLPRMQQLHPILAQQPIAQEHLEHPMAEEFLHRGQTHRRQRVENPLLGEATVGGHDMQVQVEVQQISEGVHADDQPGFSCRLLEQDPEDKKASGSPEKAVSSAVNSTPHHLVKFS